ncbi:hypothetical protein HOLDEFILI_02007 [Holdemania filiformis DSM 12042]|uniref:Uncharacterized protein n=1 Tax=Holdemania filiformis DSM 12042 TaxID=545696 RepID=B9Y860_9FIRM|nr:hypothetical protein HOLDEFILI_02007 [Holdemania filiformis DSM 12042]
MGSAYKHMLKAGRIRRRNPEYKMENKKDFLKSFRKFYALG